MRQSLGQIEVPKDLFGKVMSRIEAERKLALAKQRLSLMISALVGSLVAGVFAWRSFELDLASSGFGEYIALGFYDLRLTLGAWRDFSLTLLESLPTVSSVGLLGVVLGLLVTLKFVVKYTRELTSASRALALRFKA